MTHFRIDDDALDVYAGKSYGQRPAPPGAVTATVDHHTLTSGTAYISIGKVYAQDRCSRDVGSTVKDVIIAMHSESILSLRYSQDHFQYFASSSTQTGYPISYADFNHPIPWSAWNGMAWCQGPAWGARCDIIYEDQYRPQLAIPGAIRKLNPRWSSCQNWYGGLYDPPLTLQTEHSFAVPTFSASVTTSQAPPTTTAEPASSVQNHPSSTVNSEISESPKVEQPGGIVALESSGGNGLEVPVPTRKYTIVTINGREYMVTPIDNGVIVGTQIVSAGGPVVRLADGSQAVFGSSGLVINAAISVAIKNGASLTFAGQTYMVQVTGKQSEVVNLGSATLSLGASPITLPNGAVATLGSNGIVVSAQTTISAGLLSGSSYTSTRTDSGKTSSSTAAVVTQSIKAPFTGSVYLSTASATESQSQSTSTSGGHAVLIRTAPLMVGILFALIQAIT
ncbi:Hypothetical protein D9617_31g064260 [Elsinoe fawcettii]|nr:Hypothetical protein D9617_31g064260 [Elsinoe fawcettii]